MCFHLELVLVAGLLQASFTDGRETLQSCPLFLKRSERRGEERVIVTLTLDV